MRIVSEGCPGCPHTPWVGVYHCPNCWCIVELKREDNHLVWDYKLHFFRANRVTITCPTCKERHAFIEIRED